MVNYLIYPTKIMNITQGYTGSYTHSQHNIGNPKDYPWDEACGDSGRSSFYCPCDKMKVVRIYGYRSGGTNTIWLESTSKVDFADGTQDYVVIMITHPNDSDLASMYKGKIYTRGQEICKEGTDGHATGNHFHLSAGKGKYKSGWVKNSKGKWVLSCTNGAYKPELLFYVDKSFTTIKNSRNIVFKTKPTETVTKKTKFTTGNYKVDTELLNVRKGAGTIYAKVKFKNMTADAQKKIKALNNGKPVDGYKKGLTFTVFQVKGDWGKTPSGWVNLKYCKKIK